MPMYHSEPNRSEPSRPSKKKPCSICGYAMQPWPGGGGYGNNAEPVNSGRCCDLCNVTRVIPARLERIYAMRENSGDDSHK